MHILIQHKFLFIKLRNKPKTSDLYPIRYAIFHQKTWENPEQQEVLLQKKLPVLEKEMQR
jgi:hypothetical protein